MPSRQELLKSISPAMQLDKNFFMKVYGYELTWPGFAKDALARLEFLGCSRAREYYNRFVSEYEKEYDEQMRIVAHWYKEQCENEFANMKRRAVRESRKDIRQMSNNELLMYLESLIAEG